jgi:uncharacterized membrane protein
MLQAFTSSWKTTVTGVLMLLDIVGHSAVMVLDGDPTTNPNWAVVVPALLAAIGLIFARDADKSSQDAGVR